MKKAFFSPHTSLIISIFQSYKFYTLLYSKISIVEIRN